VNYRDDVERLRFDTLGSRINNIKNRVYALGGCKNGTKEIDNF